MAQAKGHENCFVKSATLSGLNLQLKSSGSEGVTSVTGTFAVPANSTNSKDQKE